MKRRSMVMHLTLALLSVLAWGCNQPNGPDGQPPKPARQGESTPEKPTEEKGGTNLGSEIPCDVDTTQQEKLTNEGKFALVQRLFDEVSWRSFVALSWPHDEKGKPKASLADEGTPYWASYSEVYEVFKPDGSAPDPYGAPRQTVPPITKVDLPDFPKPPKEAIKQAGTRLLYNLSSTNSINVLDEVNQAFSSPLWDQNGNLVHYEVLLNQAEYDYIFKNELYNVEGQEAYSQANGAAEFPSGEFGTNQVGAIEVKLAWRLLEKHDIQARYVTSDAYIITGSPPQWEKVKVGLVGMHISHKTKSSPQWIWSTFEHVDNLRVNAFEAMGANAKDHPKLPSFNDPNCEYCPTNVPPDPDENGLRKTQVSRVIPIPKATAQYNAQIQQALAKMGSKLQYYELINTQWPTDPSSPPAAVTEFPASITNKSGGKPTPVYLVNSTMETYFQGGATGRVSQKNKDFPEVRLLVDDEPEVRIPTTNGGNVPLKFAEGFCYSVNADCEDAGKHLVQSVESCMGCHSSAPMAGTQAQLSGDFSWLLSQKACPKKPGKESKTRPWCPQ